MSNVWSYFWLGKKYSGNDGGSIKHIFRKEQIKILEWSAYTLNTYLVKRRGKVKIA